MVRMAGLCVALATGGVVAEPVVHQPTGITFPDEIAGFQRRSEFNFEAKQPGFGFSYTYSLRPAVVATVYVYGADLCPVPPGTGEAVARMRDTTIGEMRQTRGTQVQALQAISREVIQFKGETGDVSVLFDSFKTSEDGQITGLWLWAARGHFLKIRLTSSTPLEGDEERARSFVAAVVRLADAPPPKWEMPPSVTIHLHPSLKTGSEAERVAWIAYAMSLLDWIRQCVPLQSLADNLRMPYAAVRHVRARHIEAWRKLRGSVQETVAYMEEMIKVVDAGFLDDYLWRYHAGPASGAAPASVAERREKFERWMSENLPAHQPQTKAGIAISRK